jgi:hypothetical protein
MGLFGTNLALGLYFQVRGHRDISAAGERYEEALQPSRRPVLLSRFRAGLAAVTLLAAGGCVGALVMHRIDSARIEGHRSAFGWCTGEREREKERLREHWAACEEAMDCCREAKGGGP